jgi:flagellar basal-body rod protein FlgB
LPPAQRPVNARGANLPLKLPQGAAVSINDIPLFGLLKGRLGYLEQRQRLISQNVANADTPGYVGRDLKAFTFDQAMKSQSGPGGVTPVRTSAGHLQGTVKPTSVWSSRMSPDSETTLDGNSVVLEEQMLKMAEARANHDAAVGFYQKSLNLIRMAARRPQ